ncbi:MAG: EFR1 family ferrodoxin [Firmicutes bacterium]|nr:EFR1 family ferrodoxin [Bacillota bacterium]
MIGILYFSSTGNSLYIAQKIQKRLGGQIKYIPSYEGNGGEFEKILVVTPIYSYGLPTFVYDLLPRLDRRKEIIIIQNYGGIIGGANYLAYQYCAKNGLNLKAVYVVKMPENYTLTFTVPQFYIKSTLKKAEMRIEKIIDKIENEQYELPQKHKTREKRYLINKSNWHIIGERFVVNEKCVKCRKCINVCPAGNIALVDGKIVFEHNCVACLGCYHRCPQKAITYLGKKKKDRYINPNIKQDDLGKDL